MFLHHSLSGKVDRDCLRLFVQATGLSQPTHSQTSDFKGTAKRGKGTMWWFYGFKLYLHYQ
uniref:transposase n=1 Tax=Candidatus Enterovibrio escicola TaxID=1927127 RepID=UPI0034DB4C2A